MLPAAPENANLLTTNRKALTINLDETRYGTFAEIGAGQEVARNFFQAGHASGTVAKTMSAYDMKFSDAIYGKAKRYVSRERLSAMLEHEYVLLLERLQASRGEKTSFFVFADTVATRTRTSDGHGWMGVRYQISPNSPPHDVIIHLRVWDPDPISQQQAIGIVGVNLLYAAFYYANDTDKLIESLVDTVGTQRVEVDMITLAGPDFAQIDLRVLNLRLVQRGLTNAIIYDASGCIQQAGELLYNRPVVVERGSFRPVTRINVDMLSCACAQFIQESGVAGKEPVVLMEMTVNNLLSSGELDIDDFLARVDTLNALGHPVMVSNFQEFFRLTAYFRRYTKERIAMAIGINTLLEIFKEKYYEHLEGGILEAVGRLFRGGTKLYVYPMRKDAYERYIGMAEGQQGPATGFTSKILITARNLQVPHNLTGLYAHLVENRFIETIYGYDETILSVFSRDVLTMMREGDSAWESVIPKPVADLIRARGLFGIKK
jgi:hypothetical protein